MTEYEIRKNIAAAMDEPKAPLELVEKGLAMARAFTASMEKKNKGVEKNMPVTPDIPVNSIGGGGLML